MTIELRSARLRVEIVPPATLRGQRFDRSAFVAQVTLDGTHRFCAVEAPGGNGGAGLCSEFAIGGAVGYDDARVGDWFVKPGVGLLERGSDAAYGFWLAYRRRAFPVRVEVDGSSARFDASALPCRGYALTTSRVVAVDGDSLTIATTLRNVGERRIVTDEYCHNFIAPGGAPMDGRHRLEWSHRVEAPACAPLAITASGATWRGAPSAPFYAPMAVAEASSSSWWRLSDPRTGLSVTETDSFAWSRFALYGDDRLVSPEAFIALDVAPGDSVHWTRTYRFACAASSGD